VEADLLWGGVPLSTWFDRPTPPRIVPALVIILGVVLFGIISLTPAPTTLAMVFQAHQAAATLQSSTIATNQKTSQAATGQATTGNGAPSGAHYDLNIHGVAQGGSASTGSNGHDIFVPLQGKCNISLSPGSFQVLDPNCLDGNAAFQLPNPVASTTTTTITTTYSVWVRALAKPGGSSSTTTCATDLTGTLVCSTAQFVTVVTRSNGKSVFSNVTGNLLFISQCINGQLTRTPLFASSLQNYFWSYDNNGLKLEQLRFYQLPTTVAASGTAC
jgi:hypothetical protein